MATERTVVEAETLTSHVGPRVLLSVTFLLLLSLFPLWGTFQHLESLNDDTYITLTYAKSLAAGEGWRYNGGPESLGTTTPLFALMVALLGKLLPFIPLEQLAIGFSLFCWMGTAWTLYLGRRHFGLSEPAALLVAAVLLLQGSWWLHSLGMEGTFQFLGLIGATWLTAAGRPLAAGIISSLLFLVRPEGAAFLPLAAIWLLLQNRTAWRGTLTRFVLGAAIPTLIWSGYAWFTFGHIIPNTISAKMGQGLYWPGDSFIHRLVNNWLPAYAARYGFSPALSLLWPLVVLGLLHAARHAKVLLLLAAWTVLFLAGYTLLHAPGYWWYMLPVLLFLQLFAALGLAHLARARPTVLRLMSITLAILFFALTLQNNIRSIQKGISDARAPTYLAISEWLRTHTAPSDTVAFIEVGYLGYYTENRIIDLVGLIQPEFTENGVRMEIAKNFWKADARYFIYTRDADWLLGGIVRDKRFTGKYRPVAELPSHLSSPMVIYERQEQ